MWRDFWFQVAEIYKQYASRSRVVVYGELRCV